MVVNNTRIINNVALGEDPYKVKHGGGGIFNHAPLHIKHSKISGNSSLGNGGGIYSIFSGRKKPTMGQIYTEKLGILASSSVQTSLHRPQQIGSIQVLHSEISDNSAETGGGLYVKGVMNIKHTVINNNYAIYYKLSSGGGIFAHMDTVLNIDNSIISRNVAKFRGGGIRFYSVKSGHLENVTVLDNQVILSHGYGAGILVIKGTHEFTLHNSVVANNFIAEKRQSDCKGEIQSTGYNLLGTSDKCTWHIAIGDIIPGSGESLNPHLTWNSKLHQYKISESSPLINNGDPQACIKSHGKQTKNNSLKKTHAINMQDFNTISCDIGAVEFIAKQ